MGDGECCLRTPDGLSSGRKFGFLPYSCGAYNKSWKVMVHRPNLFVDMLSGSQNVGPQCLKGFEMIANLKFRRCHIKNPYSVFFEKKIRISGTHFSRETINESWKAACSSIYHSLYCSLWYLLHRGHLPDKTYYNTGTF